jgi:hypothetical protein
MGRFDRLFNAETEPTNNTSLLANSQISKEVNQRNSKLPNQQTSKETNQQASKLANQQTSELANPQNSKPVIPIQLSTKQKKKYGTYLREDSILDIRVHAAQSGKKDHEFLQEIVGYYFDRAKS